MSESESIRVALDVYRAETAAFRAEIAAYRAEVVAWRESTSVRFTTIEDQLAGLIEGMLGLEARQSERSDRLRELIEGDAPLEKVEQ